MDEVTLSRQIGSKTGGIYPSVFSGGIVPKDDVIATGDDIVYKLFLHGKAVQSKSDDLFDLMFDILTSAKFDNQKRIVEVRERKHSYFISLFDTHYVDISILLTHSLTLSLTLSHSFSLLTLHSPLSPYSPHSLSI